MSAYRFFTRGPWRHRRPGLSAVALTAASALVSLAVLAVPAQAAPPDTTPPTSPRNLTRGTVTPTTVALSWTASTDNVGVRAYRVYANSTLVKTVAGNPPVTTTTAELLAPSTLYVLNVRAVDAAGNVSGPSNAVTVTTAPVPLAGTIAFSNVHETNMTLTWPTLNWAAAGVTGYRVYRSTDGVHYTLLDTFPYVSGNSAALTVTGLSAWTLYRFKVVALIGTVEGAPIYGTQKTDDETAPDQPDPPTGAATEGTEDSITLTWDKVADKPIGSGSSVTYQICMEKVEEVLAGMDGVCATPESPTSGPTVSGDTVTATVDGLEPGTKYKFKVRAKDEKPNLVLWTGLGWSDEIQTGDITSPNAPTHLRADQIAETSARLTWPIPYDNVATTDYQVCETGDPVPTATPSPSPTSTSTSTSTSNLSAGHELAGTQLQGNNSPSPSPSPSGSTCSAISPDMKPLGSSAHSTSHSSPEPGVHLTSTPECDQEEGTCTVMVDGMEPSTSYTFTVIAGDAADNWSGESNFAVVVTPTIYTTTVPEFTTEWTDNHTVVFHSNVPIEESTVVSTPVIAFLQSTVAASTFADDFVVGGNTITDVTVSEDGMDITVTLGAGADDGDTVTLRGGAVRSEWGIVGPSDDVTATYTVPTITGSFTDATHVTFTSDLALSPATVEAGDFGGTAPGTRTPVLSEDGKTITVTLGASAADAETVTLGAGAVRSQWGGFGPLGVVTATYAKVPVITGLFTNATHVVFTSDVALNPATVEDVDFGGTAPGTRTPVVTNNGKTITVTLSLSATSGQTVTLSANSVTGGTFLTGPASLVTATYVP